MNQESNFEFPKETHESTLEYITLENSGIKLLSLTQDDWFQILEDEGPKFLENAEKILDTVKKVLIIKIPLHRGIF